MKQTQLFTKTRKESPKDEVSKNADILIRAGFIHKEMAGVYSLLPLGLRVIKKIKDIIRVEMNGIGGQEMEMSSLQQSDIWEKSNKWDDEVVDVWFKTKLKNDTELGLAFSHEEAMAEMMKSHINSYKDLPVYPYQFQTKFRNETRSKSGILRGREFIMKDMYSFGRNQEDLDKVYRKVKKAYQTIFERAGIGENTYYVEASGGVFGEKSHEFQTICDAGEDHIYIDREKKIGINEEIYSKEKVLSLGLKEENLEKVKSIEVGNIFPIGTAVSKNLEMFYVDKEGVNQEIYMGSYGIGLGRLMGTVVETYAKENEMIWPLSISPFEIHIIEATPDAKDYAHDLYMELTLNGYEVLLDDRDKRAGEKFQDSDLIGIPFRLVVGNKALNEGQIEVLDRKKGETILITRDEVVKGKYLTE